METLDHTSPVPLYHQLAELLRARIRSGRYPVGSKLPPETALASSFGIGRPTVRQALEELRRLKLVVARRGSGTYVTESPPRVDLLSLAGTMASFAKRGIEVVAEIVEGPAMKEISEDDSENPFAGQSAYLLSRLSRVRAEPVLLEQLYFDPQLFPGLEHIEVAGRSVSKMVAEQYRTHPVSATQNFRVVRCDGWQAALLGVPQHEPILLVQRFLHFPRGSNGVYAELSCRTDQLVFSQTIGGVEHG